jgi:hypothetical protein
VLHVGTLLKVHSLVILVLRVHVGRRA